MSLIDDKQLLFVVGIPRSGTTWTQLLLSSHPDVVSGRETHLFQRYVQPLLKKFDWEKETGAADGMSRYMTRPQFLENVVGPMFRAGLEEIAKLCPSAPIVLEKTPSHLHSLPQIDRMTGKRARFLHVIRDPRAVVASWKAGASEDWGHWADKPVREIVTRWRVAHSKEKFQIRKELFGSRYRTIHYETLLENTESELDDIFGWLNLPVDADTLREIVDRNRLPALAASSSATEATDPRKESRRNFFRKGRPDSWKEELALAEIATIEEIAGLEMSQLGYAVHDTI
jgi:hypothetical protein